MPMDRSKYPPDWKAISLRIRERAGWRREQCGIAQGEPTKSGGPVVLTVAHLNHDTTDNRDENLRAWCQACHTRYDAAHHAENARATRTRKRIAAAQQAGQSMLFQEEPMPTDDDQQQPLITESAQVTSEFVTMMLDASAEWEAHFAHCFLCLYGEERCSEGQRLLLLATGGQE